MGGQQSSRPKNLPPVDKIRFEMMCQNTFHHAELQRDRKIHELQKKESNLKDLVKANKGNCNRESISMEASNCISLLNYIKGANNILNQIRMLKENSLDIVNFLNRQPSMNFAQLEPHIFTVIWSTSRLNLSQIKEFSDFIAMYMGPGIYQVAEQSPMVDLNFKRLFSSITAEPLQIHDYLEKFCDRNSLSLDLISGLWGGGPGPQAPINFPPQPPVQPPQPPVNNFPAQPPVQPPAPFVPPQQPNYGQTASIPQFPPSPVTTGTPSGYPFDKSSQNAPTNPFAALPGDINTRISELKRIGA